MNSSKKILFIVQFAVLLAIEALFCFTPLGSIPIGPMVATLAMIPVIIAGQLMGVAAGSLMGFFAGTFSLIVWTFFPPPLSAPLAFVFTPFYKLGAFSGNFGSLLICFVPRILTGTFAGLAFRSLSMLMPSSKLLPYSISAVLACLTNTAGVLGGIWLFFGEQYSTLLGAGMLYLIGMTILTNGIPEAVVSALISPAVCRPVQLGQRRSRASRP